MTAAHAILVVSIFLLTDAVVIVVLVPAMVRESWGKLSAAFPPVEPAADAIRRSFQSFGADWCNFGWCVHAAADEGHLHLSPARLARVFGARAMSIPWQEITPVKAGSRSDVVRVRGVMVTGPKWALGLAGEYGGPGARPGT